MEGREKTFSVEGINEKKVSDVISFSQQDASPIAPLLQHGKLKCKLLTVFCALFMGYSGTYENSV